MMKSLTGVAVSHPHDMAAGRTGFWKRVWHSDGSALFLLLD